MKFESSYSHIMRKDNEGILLLDRETEHLCKCGVTFMGTRNASWCAACKPIARAKRIQRSQAKQRKKRAEARALRVAS